MTPGLKFSMTMSAFDSSLRATALPSAEDRSKAMLRLLRFMPAKYELLPGPNRASKARDGSPRPGRSILMTSAPRSPRNDVHHGPAANWLKSTTRMPSTTPRDGPGGCFLLAMLAFFLFCCRFRRPLRDGLVRQQRVDSSLVVAEEAGKDVRGVAPEQRCRQHGGRRVMAGELDGPAHEGPVVPA